MRFCFALIAVLILAACGGLTVEKAPLQQPEYPPGDARPSPIGFNKIRYAIPTGSSLVSYSPKGMLGLLTCAGPYGTAEGGIYRRVFPSDNAQDIFRDTIEAQGYDVAGDPGRMFDEEEDRMRSVYSIGARVIDMKVDLCREVNFWGIHKGDSGEASVTIEWTVFDLLNRRNAYKTVTKGYAKRKIPNYEGVDLLLEDSFAAAAHNLGADKEFYSLIFYGETPLKMPDTASDWDEEPIALYDPREQVVLAASQISTVPVQDSLENALQAVVMLQAGHTHSSGFFITDQGHILTNAHAVGNASRVRVVTSGKENKLIAEVLRLDRKRDIALLKLEDVEGLNIVTLPLRLSKPKVGEDVYAIGAPLVTRLQDTVTKGIVSALRFNKYKKQPYIQADVAIYSGDSGGPLLDENGNVIGVAVSGYESEGVDIDSLNNFIPIGDALEKLDITLQ